MRGFLLVLKAEVVRSWIITRRYWFRTLTGIIVGYGMLMGLILGFMASRDNPEDAGSGAPAVTANAQQQSGPASLMTPGMPKGLVNDPAKATTYVLGFVIGLFAFGIVGLFTQGLQGMAQTGVLEQLCLSPHGLVTNFLVQSFVGGINTILSSGIMLWLITWSLQGTLYWDWVAVPLVLALSFIDLLGFGFMVGGLVLIFKQTGQLAILVRLGLFGMALFGDEKLLQGHWLKQAFLHVLPVTDAAICLKYVLVQGQGAALGGPIVPVYAHPTGAFWFLIVNAAVWTGIGIVCFRLMESHSRLKGTLGSY